MRATLFSPVAVSMTVRAGLNRGSSRGLNSFLLSTAAAGSVTYSIATSNGSAAAGSDYVARNLSGETIPAGRTSRTFAVTSASGRLRTRSP